MCSTVTRMHITLLDGALKDGQDGKFYVMCIYHNKNTLQMKLDSNQTIHQH